MKALKFLIGLTAALLLVSCDQKKDIPDAEVTAVAKEAYIYGYPMVKNYKEMYASAIDTQSPEYKKPLNELYMAARVDTPADQVKETASNDTPYGSVWLDLRREPLVLTVPAVEDSRYYSVQFTDLYAYNFDYVGTRIGGNKGGKFLIAGPDWKGEKPEGIDRVIQSDTQFAYGLVRIQLLNPEDMPTVAKIQDAFALVPLSQFSGAAAPAEVAPVNFPAYSDEKVITPEFFSYLNFVMQFAKAQVDEAELMKRFDKIGVGAGKSFSMEGMGENEKKALQSGIDGAIADLDAAVKGDLVKGADMHGTRADLKNNYLNRAYGAMVDPYGASPQEILSISYKLDSEFKVLNGANHYTIRFEKDKLPPANAFWSLTMYELPGQLLVDNPVKRYTVDSTMVSNMVTDPADGSVTIFIQKDSPGSEPMPKAAETAPKAADAAKTDTAPKATSAAPAAADAAKPLKIASPAPADAGKVTAAAPKAADTAKPAVNSAAEKKPAAADTAAKPAADAARKPAVAQPVGTLSANWLPAPEGDFYMVMRIYIPKEDALNGTWKEPAVMRFNTEEVPAEGAAAQPADAAKPADTPAADGAKPAEAQPSGTAPAAKPADAKAAAPATAPAEAAKPVATQPAASSTPAKPAAAATMPAATGTTPAAAPAATPATKPAATARAATTQPAAASSAAKPAATTGGQSGTAQPAPKP
ncbi:DUF1254 domain-containing protein [Oxalobacter vibrioformis]|uniref:DUF1254 domain-containing protein n=1 Tax=Oxalobacter vibrioformis TaxID=933080 RepID=A0A9E9LUM2_9BURK|nr:DUF1254 domain-containing protein [Oxalobacter vibrioformis]WAW09471.1 DUF1254 domain-containing protein [Oxalobacter vibrioformis]